jgi:hypothetical protein
MICRICSMECVGDAEMKRHAISARHDVCMILRAAVDIAPILRENDGMRALANRWHDGLPLVYEEYTSLRPIIECAAENAIEDQRFHAYDRGEDFNLQEVVDIACEEHLLHIFDGIDNHDILPCAMISYGLLQDGLETGRLSIEWTDRVLVCRSFPQTRRDG